MGIEYLIITFTVARKECSDFYIELLETLWRKILQSD